MRMLQAVWCRSAASGQSAAEHSIPLEIECEAVQGMREVSTVFGADLQPNYL